MNRRDAETQSFLMQKAKDKSKNFVRNAVFSPFVFCRKISASLRLCGLILLFSVCLFAQNKYENRQISKVEISFAETGRERSSTDQFLAIVRSALGDKYSSVRVRDALQALYESGRIVSATVEATDNGADAVNLKFLIKRKTQAERVSVVIGNFVGDEVTEQELLLRLNIVNPGTAITEQTLQSNANLILEYLRDRGYYKADVKFTQAPLTDQTRVAVTFQVNPNAQARIENFDINIVGFDPSKVRKDLELKPGEVFSKAFLERDVEKIREAMRKEKFLAPELEEPHVVFDSEKNTINIDLRGKVGATVNITVDAGEDEKVGDKTQTKLLSIKREGTLDYSAIIEGARRLRNYFQEQGYFFADVSAVCSVNPVFTENEASEVVNETESLCSSLSGAELSNRVVDVKYKANLNRRLKLVDIRIEGTNQFKVEEIQSVLSSQEANALGFIPYFGYGRGYTSTELIEEDRRTLVSLMRELGFRQATVTVRQGVSVTGADLILTFVINEGIPTRIDGLEITGNKAFDEATLLAKLPTLIGKNFSRARARNGVKEIAAFYSREGFYDAKVTYSITELGADAASDHVKIVYNIENEGRKVIVNRILINGNVRTDRDAILRAINLQNGGVLRSADIFTSEQNLYATDAFGLVDIKPEPAGENANGDRLSDIIISVEEKAPRLITYGGGFSSDSGVNAFFDIRHFNLFGKLQQGGAQIRVSRLKQLAQIDFINPRFMKDGKTTDGVIRYAPLTFTAMYQRDSTVTRFFRSTFDKGTLGIVQRVDENGNPIDEFGADTGVPTINRLSLALETSRTISQKYRSIAFLRYRYEDVRLYNIESLLVRDLLRPDSKVKISGFGANFAFDTRENCNIKYTILDIIAKGEPGEPCKYNPSDPTRGMYLTAEYNVSIPFLGANVGFQKFQGSFYKFYTFPKLRNITLAGRAILGLATVFKRNQSFSSSQFPDLEGILPISERFFAGGSTSIRGFEFESAGPRVVVVPQGIFRNSNGDAVYLNPFAIPFGGNALAIVNIEARIPVTKSIRVVPFYDGGNVFRRVSDIFKPQAVDATDVFRQNLRALWSNTFGLGLRLKTPIGGEFAVDYGYLLNPPRFLIPQQNAPNAIFQPRREQLHFRFAQAF
jgi:outer membrane protein insertion porin family